MTSGYTKFLTFEKGAMPEGVTVIPKRLSTAWCHERKWIIPSNVLLP